MKRIAITGHREIPLSMQDFAFSQALKVAKYTRDNDGLVANGGAEGWDLLVLEACHELGADYCIYFPFGFSKKKIPDEIIRGALFAEVKKKEYQGRRDNWVYFARNDDIIGREEDTELHCWWDGRKKGGTWDAIKKTRKLGLEVKNYYPIPELKTL